MAKIQVLLHGQLLSELLLEAGREFYAGRGSNCHILLANERGISRQHVRFIQENGVWVALLVAKYGSLIYEGDSVEKILLNGEIRFAVPPYEFVFSEVEAVQFSENNPELQMPESEDPLSHSENSLSHLNSSSSDQPGNNGSPGPLAPQHVPEFTAHQNAKPLDLERQENFDGNLDATSAGVAPLIAYIKVYNGRTRTEEVFRLEGNVWSVGRHPNCDILIQDSAFSRKHFELSRTTEGYFVTDCESSNGTNLNGDRILPHQPMKLVSGDIIAIKHIEFIFELHDGAYKNKVNELPPIEASALIPFEMAESSPEVQINSTEPNPMIDGASYLPAPQDYNHEKTGPTEHVLKIPPSSINHFKGFKPNKIHIIIGILLVILIFGLFGKKNSTESNIIPIEGSTNQSSTVTSPSELSPDKQKELKDVFNLAHNYYLQRKYVLCISQIEKLHSIVPFYNNSKEVEALCHQGQELDQIEQERRRKEDEAAAAKTTIEKTVQECRDKMTESTTSEEIKICLQPASELEPENSKIVDLITEIATKEDRVQSDNLKKIEFVKRRKSGTDLFNRAVDHYKSGQLKAAHHEFTLFLKGKYPGLNQKEDAAKRNIASINEELNKLTAEKITLCQSALDRSDYKSSIKACEDVLKEDSNNQGAKDLLKKATTQLNKELKSLYDDAALEENMGNIEAAKEKWGSILEKSLPKENYYEKSRKKLSKYGIGQ